LAKRNEQDLSFLNSGLNKKLAQKIQDEIDIAHKNIYFGDNDDAKYIDAIRKRIDKDLNFLIDKTRMRNNGMNISNLYARTMNTDNSNELVEFKKALQDESVLSDLMDMYSQNAVQRDMDREIDTVCKYVPNLQKALNIKANHVLCADHFTRDSLNIEILTNETGKNTPDSSNTPTAQYTAKGDIESFKRKYKIVKLVKDVYKKTAKYGEEFIYIVSYTKALNRLLKKGENSGLITESTVLDESTINQVIESTCKSFKIAYGKSTNENESILTESFYDYDDLNPNMLSNLTSNAGFESLEIEYNDSGVIPSFVSERQSAGALLEQLYAIHEADGLSFNNKTLMSNRSYLNKMNKQFRNFSKEGGSFKLPENLSIDGFVEKKYNTEKTKDEEVNVPGAIVKRLDHTMVKILNIDEVVLGYWYIEVNREMIDKDQTTFSNTLGGLRPRRSTRNREDQERPGVDDQILARIAKQISDKINGKFINANQDLSKEIYTILKYNADHGNGGKISKIRVSFIPPEDIVHSYFELNEKTKRGKSDLELSLFPGKLLSCLYISNVIALLTRGYDRRAYYVKQSVDTNIHQVLINVINQIKQSNFNLRQIENMNNILNITGRFNDMVIPQNSNGESPVSFEVIPGQNIEIKTEFMNMLEETAIGLIGGITLEMVRSQEQEQTATHLTMTNAKLLIDIFERQMAYEDIISELITKIYQIEYGVEDELKVELPPPVMLNFTNTSQILTVANELIQNIVTMKMGPDNQQSGNEGLRNAFIGRLMRYYFKTFLPMEEIDQMYEEAETEMTATTSSMQQDPNSMGGNMQGGY